jgi:hypothetical protein
MKLLNFEHFKKLESILENEESFGLSLDESAALWDAEQIINEAFSSSIMQTLFDADTDKGRWQKGFAADMYKNFKIAVSDIQDTDFQLLTDPSLAFQRPIKGDDNKLVFFINDDTSLRDSWTEWQKGRAPFPFLVSIVRGGVGLWYGFRKEPSKGYRSSQGKEDRYGVLAKEYTSQSYFGTKGTGKVTQSSIVDLSTKAYVLDINSCVEKYSAGSKQTDRALAKRGALALMDTKKIKADNIARYKKILSEKVGPADTLAKFQKVWTNGLNGITAWINATKLDNLDVVKNYAQFDFGGWNRQDIGSTIQQLYRSYGEYIRDYVDFCRTEKRLEMYATAIETGKDPETGDELSPETISKMNGSILYYQQDLAQKAVKFVEYNHYFDKCDKQITAGIELLKTTLTEDKSKFDTSW